jgi:hypothetical protein
MRRVTRRAAIVAGVAGAVSLLARPALAEGVSAGALNLQLPDSMSRVPDDAWGRRWQLCASAGPLVAPRLALAARGDLALVDAREGLAVLLTAADSGALPGFRLGAVVPARVPGSASALRADVSYRTPAGDTLSGAAVSAAGRSGEPGCLVLFVGGAAMSAAVLDRLVGSLSLGRHR